MLLHSSTIDYPVQYCHIGRVRRLAILTNVSLSVGAVVGHSRAVPPLAVIDAPPATGHDVAQNLFFFYIY